MNIISSSVSLHVEDTAASCHFLTTHLDFREVLAVDGFVSLRRDDGAVDIGLYPRDLEQSPEQSGRDELAAVIVSFAVTGIAEEDERLRREGANITTPLRREPWGEWLLRLTDPNGIVVQLVEWTPPSGS